MKSRLGRRQERDDDGGAVYQHHFLLSTGAKYLENGLKTRLYSLVLHVQFDDEFAPLSLG